MPQKKRIHGATKEERDQARVKREVKNRSATFSGRIRAATSGREVLIHACNYALAVGKRRLDDAGRRLLARKIVELVDERNQA